jgi:threonine/homoserine/homoserine lactone efflux protein
VCGLVLGVVGFLRAPAAVKAIGVVGGVMLLYMGYSLIREALRGGGLALAGAGEKPAGDIAAQGRPASRSSAAARLPPSLAGVLLSMSNPYWWIWWVTVGSAFLLRFDITMSRWGALLAFFLGHELGDLAWYTTVSTTLHLGRRSIPRRLMTVILAACGAVIIGFALYLGITPFLRAA